MIRGGRGSGSPASAYSRALDALARRSRSSSDIARWLLDRGYDRAEVDAIVARLTAAGLLDDARYADAFARSWLVGGRQSRRRVQAELVRHGVARDVASAAIERVIRDEGLDEVAAIRRVAEQKFRALARLEPDVARRRLMAFLVRRGYDGDLVRRVASELMRGSSMDD